MKATDTPIDSVHEVFSISADICLRWLLSDEVALDQAERWEEPAIDGEKDAPVVAPGVRPVHDAAVHVRLSRAVRERVESPEQRALVGAERNDGDFGSRRVQHAVHDDRCRLNLPVPVEREITGVIDPRDLQLRDVRYVDLIER